MTPSRNSDSNPKQRGDQKNHTDNGIPLSTRRISEKSGQKTGKGKNPTLLKDRKQQVTPSAPLPPNDSKDHTSLKHKDEKQTKSHRVPNNAPHNNTAGQGDNPLV